MEKPVGIVRKRLVLAGLQLPNRKNASVPNSCQGPGPENHFESQPLNCGT